ncbi:rubredoxin [Pseudomonas sp. PA-4-8C]|uniref:rubredoxin n=1 Tax=Pseudomonas sp. PA-4-8C TaxID=2665476 RepID=UPI001F368A25|nr:rubredoxin [Pseudomonas sp. PA-4-8C]MCF5370698.1 rubredoxin [Pseudomonas sp. PA-4-8C]
MKPYMGEPRGFMYEEELGIPGNGIPEGTPWEEVPEDWACPDCGVTKADFMAINLPEPQEA